MNQLTRLTWARRLTEWSCQLAFAIATKNWERAHDRLTLIKVAVEKLADPIWVDVQFPNTTELEEEENVQLHD